LDAETEGSEAFLVEDASGEGCLGEEISPKKLNLNFVGKYWPDGRQKCAKNRYQIDIPRHIMPIKHFRADMLKKEKDFK
jgi:hypothetical protein